VNEKAKAWEREERGAKDLVLPLEFLRLPCPRLLPRLLGANVSALSTEPLSFRLTLDWSRHPSLLRRTRKHVSKEELRERERIHQETEGNDYNLIRKAAEVHRQVRQYAKRTIKPGMSMIQIADLIEDTLRALVEVNGLEAGIGFPTGLSLNEVAAHYHPNSTDKRSK